MLCPQKPHPLLVLLTNTLIVLLVFMIVDYLYYTVIAPVPDYQAHFGERLLHSALFAIAYAHLYNKASRIWKPNDKAALVYRNYVTKEADTCKATWPKIANGIVFNLLLVVLIFFMMVLGLSFIYVVWVDVLQGIRGDLELPLSEAAVVGGKLILAGATLELSGKTEDDPDW